jgi:hypothetical protein
MLGHPLKGRRETELPFDPTDTDGSRRLCAENPLFVFDPNNLSNRPLPGVQEVLLNFWPIYTESLRTLFIRSFTAGLRDPDARVMENEWRKELSNLRDAIFHCPRCTAENFFDIDRVRRNQKLNPCWSCSVPLELPPRMRIGGNHGFMLVALSEGAQLFPHHLEADTYNFTEVRAQVATNPLSLRNLSHTKWTTRLQNGSIIETPPNTILQLTDGCHIHFGQAEADIKL